jgi:hypothetical protein
MLCHYALLPAQAECRDLSTTLRFGRDDSGWNFWNNIKRIRIALEDGNALYS